MKTIIEAILNRNKDTIKDAMEEEFLRKFFSPNKYGKHESGLYKREDNIIIINLSKLWGTHSFGNIETWELYKELGITHYKFIGNNLTENLFTKIDFMLINAPEGITIEYISPIKDSYILLNSMYYKGVKEIKGNVELHFNNSLILNYDQRGFWRVDKMDLKSAGEIYKHTGFAYQIMRVYDNFDIDILEEQLESPIARRTGKQTIYDVLEGDVMYYFRYRDGMFFIIKNPKQSDYKYVMEKQGIQLLNINNFKQMSGFQVHFMKF